MALELGLKSRSGGPSAPKASRGLGSCGCQEQTAGKEHVPSSSGLHTRARRFVLGFVCLSVRPPGICWLPRPVTELVYKPHACVPCGQPCCPARREAAGTCPHP